uniref:Uncharacterized protein n=1 Tax=Arundo donax TaxID=35708 RepID=A0A0A8Y3D3_ARUDO
MYAKIPFWVGGQLMDILPPQNVRHAHISRVNLYKF